MTMFQPVDIGRSVSNEFTLKVFREINWNSHFNVKVNGGQPFTFGNIHRSLRAHVMSRLPTGCQWIVYRVIINSVNVIAREGRFSGNGV